MEFTKIDANYRQSKGKGAARRMRQDNRAPAVIYGKGIETIPVSVVPKELVQALAGPLRTNTPLSIDVAGAPKSTPKQVLAIVKDHQYEPVSRNLLHVDFLAIEENTSIEVKVPLKTSGRSQGEQIGGIVTINVREIPVSCMPANIPAEIVADVSALNLLDTISVRDLPVPEGVVVNLPPESSVISVLASRAVEEDTAAKEGEEGEAEAVEGDNVEKEESK